MAVWVGYPDRLQPMLTEFNGDPVAGGTYPALIWKTFMKSALAELDDQPEYFPGPSYPYAAPVRVTFRDGHWMRDNGHCRDVETFVFFSGSEPNEEADCQPNEVEVPTVIGAKVAEAQARLADQPLQASIVYRPVLQGEKPGIVVAQDPKDGTLAAFSVVKLVVGCVTETLPGSSTPSCKKP